MINEMLLYVVSNPLMLNEFPKKFVDYTWLHFLVGSLYELKLSMFDESDTYVVGNIPIG